MEKNKAAKKIRILFVHSPGHYASGPDNSLFELVSRLDRNRYALYLAIPEYSGLVEKFRPYIEELFITDAVKIVSPPKNLLSAVRYLLQSLRLVPQLARLLTEHNIDLVHSNVESTWRMGLAARIKNIPSIVHIRGLTSISGGARSRIVPIILRFVGDEFVAVSEGVAGAYRAAGLPGNRLNIVPNGVDTDRFKPSSEKHYLHAEFGLQDNSICIGSIGSADPRKGWAYLVMAFPYIKKHFPDAFCFLVGNKTLGETPFYKNYSYLEVITGLVNCSGIDDSLFITGVIQDMPKVYDSLCLVVQPSLTEAGPRAVLEAMAMGKPVVATRVPGNSSYLPEFKAGVLTQVRYSEEMSDAIRMLLEDPAMMERMSQYGRQHVEQNYSIQEQVAKIDRLYMRILASKSGLSI